MGPHFNEFALDELLWVRSLSKLQIAESLQIVPLSYNVRT